MRQKSATNFLVAAAHHNSKADLAAIFANQFVRIQTGNFRVTALAHVFNDAAWINSVSIRDLWFLDNLDVAIIFMNR